MPDISIKRKNGASIDILYPLASWNNLDNKPTTYTPTAHTHALVDVRWTGSGDSATVASGDYIPFLDTSDSFKLKMGGISFGAADGTFLSKAGTWATPAGGSSPTVARLTADSSISTTTWTSTSLTTGSLAVGVYKLKLIGGYGSSATTTGIGVGLVTSGTVTKVVGSARGGISASTVATELAAPIYAMSGTAGISGSYILTTGVSSTSLQHHLEIDISFEVTVAGSVTIYYKSEVESSYAWLKAGTCIIVENIA